MLMRRDFDLNSVDVYSDSAHGLYTDSLREAFRKTMLSQEIVFQSQVHELHRIYQMQKMLMQGDNWMEFDRYDLNVVDVEQSKSQEFFYRLQQRPFGCEVPGNHYAGHVVNGTDHQENLNLSLSGEGNKRKHSAKRTWLDLEFSRDVIDLEESTETISNEDSGNNAHSFGSAALTAISESKHESQKSVLTEQIISSGLKKDQPHDSERCYRNSSTEKQQISSYMTLDFDLNEVYCDDSPCHSNDLMITHPSTVSSSDPFHELFGSTEEGSSESQIGTKECDNSSNEARDVLHPNNVQTSSPINAEGNHERTESCARRLIFDELHSSEEVLGPSQDFGCHENDLNYGIVLCTSEVLQSQIHLCPATKEVDIDKGKIEDDILASLDHSHIDSACHIGDNESSNAETAHSKVESANPVLSEKSLRSSRSEEEKDESDSLVREAAESLLHLAFESLACYQDCSEIDNKKTAATPQCSIDSFERFTLGLEDCAEDDLCVSSKPVEVDLTENKDYSLKIRRGRRLKDFQRDILPGLASLSRHEICEDINILEGVLRSREYRKMRAKLGDDGQNSRCLPARSRRPRLSCTKRRRFS